MVETQKLEISFINYSSINPQVNQKRYVYNQIQSPLSSAYCEYVSPISITGNKKTAVEERKG